MRFPRLVSFGLALVLFAGYLFLAPLGRAQSDLLPLLGTPPQTPMMNIPNGVLNLKNGNIHLEFPLRTYVQRNGFKTQVKLTYDSLFYYEFRSTNTLRWLPMTSSQNAYGWGTVTSPGSGAVHVSVYRDTSGTLCPDNTLTYYPITYSNW